MDLRQGAVSRPLSLLGTSLSPGTLWLTWTVACCGLRLGAPSLPTAACSAAPAPLRISPPPGPRSLRIDSAAPVDGPAELIRPLAFAHALPATMIELFGSRAGKRHSDGVTRGCCERSPIRQPQLCNSGVLGLITILRVRFLDCRRAGRSDRVRNYRHSRANCGLGAIGRFTPGGSNIAGMTRRAWQLSMTVVSNAAEPKASSGTWRRGCLPSHWAVMPELVTRAGPRTASRPSTMPIHMRPSASPWCTMASSRISGNCARRWKRRARTFASETDTEVVVHLVHSYLLMGYSPQEAVWASLPQLRGAFALVFLFNGYRDLLIGARRGSPLAVGYGNGETYLGSDAIALAPFADGISYLEDGDCVVLSREKGVIRDANGAVVAREVLKTGGASFVADKANYRHFMAKEICEQPDVVGRTLAHYVDMSAERAALPIKLPFHFSDVRRATITACGTASYAGAVGEVLDRTAGAYPGRCRYCLRVPLSRSANPQGDLAIFISQSGETADTLAALRHAKAKGRTPSPS